MNRVESLGFSSEKVTNDLEKGFCGMHGEEAGLLGATERMLQKQKEAACARNLEDGRREITQ